MTPPVWRWSTKRQRQSSASRRQGAKLAEAAEQTDLHGGTGIAHTRWATHGEPTEANAHPHVSDYITVVHNGIIENHEPLRELLIERGYRFSSETDTEVIAHLVHWEQQQGGTLLEVVQRVIPQLRGAYGTVVMDSRDPSVLSLRAPAARWLSAAASGKTSSLPINWRCCRSPAASSSWKKATWWK